MTHATSYGNQHQRRVGVNAFVTPATTAPYMTHDRHETWQGHLNSINTADRWYEFKEEFKQLLITKNYYDERLECSTCNRSFRNMAYSGHMRRCGKPSKQLSAHSASAWGDRDRDLSMEYGFVVDSIFPADSLVSNNKKKAKMKDYFINEKNQCHMRELEDLFRSRHEGHEAAEEDFTNLTHKFLILVANPICQK